MTPFEGALKMHCDRHEELVMGGLERYWIRLDAYRQCLACLTIADAQFDINMRLSLEDDGMVIVDVVQA